MTLQTISNLMKYLEKAGYSNVGFKRFENQNRKQQGCLVAYFMDYRELSDDEILALTNKAVKIFHKFYPKLKLGSGYCYSEAHSQDRKTVKIIINYLIY